MRMTTESLMPYLNDVNRYDHVVVMGYNADVDAAWEDLTSLGGTYNALGAAGEHIHLVSNSAEDDPAPLGTGAHSVKFFYIDANGTAQSETIALNGAAAVQSVATNIAFLNGAYVVDAGTGKAAAGQILIKNAAESANIGEIAVGASQAFLGIYRVPVGYHLDLVGMQFSSYISGAGASMSYVRLLIENWNRVVGVLVTTNSEHFQTAVYGASQYVDFLHPLHVPENAVIRIQANGAAANNYVTGYIEGFLHKV